MLSAFLFYLKLSQKIFLRFEKVVTGSGANKVHHYKIKQTNLDRIRPELQIIKKID